MLRAMRSRRVLRWTCRTLCLACTLAWICSLRWTAFISPRGTHTVGVTSGALFWTHAALPPGNVITPGIVIYSLPPGRWWWVSERNAMPYVWRPQLSRGQSFSSATLPLWIPLVLGAVSEVTLALLARRARSAAACRRCAYDRTGLDPLAPCPECGTNPTP
jgi:hypothetical protein